MVVKKIPTSEELQEVLNMVASRGFEPSIVKMSHKHAVHFFGQDEADRIWNLANVSKANWITFDFGKTKERMAK